MANTDARQLINYLLMEKHAKELEFEFCISYGAFGEQYLKRQFSRVLNRFPIHEDISQALKFRLSCLSWLDTDIAAMAPDVLVSYGAVPMYHQTPRHIPVFYTGGLMTNGFLKAKFGSDNIAEKRTQQIDFESRKIDAVDVYHSHSEASTRLLKKFFPQSEEKFFTAPFFIPDLNRIATKDFTQKWEEPRRQVIFVGNQARRKRLDMLLRAWSAMGGARDDTKFLIVSNFADGPVEIPANQNIRVQSNLSHREVLNLMRSSHFLFMPSDRESYGLVFIEAMASGCAILCADTEIQREVVVEHGAGVACDPTEFDDVVAKMRTMLEAEAPEIWGRNGRNAFEKKYAPDIVARQYVDSWRELAQER